MKKTLIAMMFLAGGAFAAPRISVGVQFGSHAPIVAARPACPGPGYSWVDGYYGTNGAYVNGYWAPPITVAPRYDRDHDGYRRFGRDRDRARFDYRRDDHDRDHDRR